MPQPQSLLEDETREDIHRQGNLWRRLRFYTTFVWRFVVLRHPEPLIYGIALTDRCNLACRGCHVSNTGRRDMTWDQLVAAMQNAWTRGFRELYFSGGEPMLWRDADHTLADAIVEAKRIGFFHVHVYTNGLLGLEPSADLVWVSMDGLPGIFERVSVWGFKHGTVPRYSSVTRDGYIGIGPGAGSHLSDGFVLNTFDLKSWIQATCDGRMATALRMPFASEMSGWWWLYWRFYDTSIPLDSLDVALGSDSPKARRWLSVIEHAGLAVRNGGRLELTEAGAFWLHLAQNYFALNYVNILWTQARQEPWPQAVAI